MPLLRRAPPRLPSPQANYSRFRLGAQPEGPRPPRRLLPDPAQLSPDVRRALPAPLRVLVEACLHDTIQGLRRHRLQARDRRRLRRHDRRDQRGVRRPGEGLPSRRHLVEDAAEGPDVRPRVGVLSFELLRRHVLECPEDRPFLGQALLRRQCRQARRSRPPAPSPSPGRSPGASLPTSSASRCRASGPDARSPAGVPCPVRPRSPGRTQRRLQRQRSLRQPVRQRLALEVLHDEVLGLAFASHVV